MKNQVKRFGQFVNESRDHMGEDGNLHRINTLGLFVIDGNYRSGRLEFVGLDEDPVEVDFPREDAEDWETEDWHHYICDIAKQNGMDAVYFPEDGTVIRC